MTLILTNAGSVPHKVQLVTSAACTVDVHADWIDNAAGAMTPGSTNTAITTATTTDIVATPTAGQYRNVKSLYIRNKHASTSVDVTVVIDQNATDFQLHSVTLLAGEMLSFVDGVGFFEYNVATALTSAIGTADLAIANTETVVVSKNCAANELVAGTTYKFTAYATKAGTTSASPIIRIRIGTTTLTGNIAATLTPPVDTLAVPISIDGIVTIRTDGAGGTALGSLQRAVHLAAVTITPAINPSTATVAVDTTAANQKIELTFISGNAANTFTFRNANLQRVN